MVGMGGGMMAMIHLVLKRPIIGVLGAAGIFVIESDGRPIPEIVTESVRSVGRVIDGSLDDGVGFLSGKLELADRRRRSFLKGNDPVAERRSSGVSGVIGTEDIPSVRPDTVSVPAVALPTADVSAGPLPMGFE